MFKGAETTIEGLQGTGLNVTRIFAEHLNGRELVGLKVASDSGKTQFIAASNLPTLEGKVEEITSLYREGITIGDASAFKAMRGMDVVRKDGDLLMLELEFNGCDRYRVLDPEMSQHFPDSPMVEYIPVISEDGIECVLEKDHGEIRLAENGYIEAQRMGFVTIVTLAPEEDIDLREAFENNLSLGGERGYAASL